MYPFQTEETNLAYLDDIVNQLAIVDQRKKWGIHSCDIKPNKDIVLGLRDEQRAQNLIEVGLINLPVLADLTIHIPCGPLTSQDVLNRYRFEIACSTYR